MSRRDAACWPTSSSPSGTTWPKAASTKASSTTPWRVRLIEIGEAVKKLDPGLLATVPAIRWRAIPRMRDQLAHHYFDTDHAIVAYVVHEELTPLRTAIVELARQTTAPDADLRHDKPSTPPPKG